MNPNDYINRFLTESPESNNDLSIDLSIFTTSLITLRENMTYVEFDNMLKDLLNANDQGKLAEFLELTQKMYNEGTDLASAFHFAWFDLINDQGEKI
jgi:hypothetical protein